MRRRPQVDPRPLPPAELLTFKVQDWVLFAPDFDPRIDTPSSNYVNEAARVANRTFNVWRDARERWRDEHGWPTDSVHFMREEVDAIRAMVDRR